MLYLIGIAKKKYKIKSLILFYKLLGYQEILSRRDIPPYRQMRSL